MPVGVIRLASYSREAAHHEAAGERTISAALATSAKAGARLDEWMQAGLHQVVITARGGGGAVRARLAIGGAQAIEQRFATPGVSISWAMGTISNRANRAEVSRTELRLLGALVDAEGESVSRRDLVAAAWPRDGFAERDSHLTVYMCLLRKRLTTIGLGDAIRTERGTGYRLSL